MFVCLVERGKRRDTGSKLSDHMELNTAVLLYFRFLFSHPAEWAAYGLFWPQWLWLVVPQNINEDTEEMKVSQKMLK